MRQYKNQYGTIFAVREKNGVPRLMCRVEEGRSWVISGVLAPRTGDAKTEEELQAVLDRTAEELGWTECKDTDAPTGAAAATTGGSAAREPSQEAETSTTSESGEDASTFTSATSSQTAETSTLAPGSPAATAPAAPSPSGAEAASLGAEFDYSGLDNQTVNDLHLAEREYASGKRMAEMGLRRMADAVAIAHEALCGGVVANCDNSKHGNRGDDAFRRWCAAIGITKDTAYRLLQVSNLFDSSTPREQKVLEELGPSLLYAAAKPSAPPELVDAVKSGDITSHKQYQDLLARYNAEKAAREQAEQERDEAATHIQAARDMQIDTARERDAALRRAVQAEAERNAARQKASAASSRAAKAEKAREEAEHIAEISRKRADRWQATAEAAQNQPVAAVVDEDEIDRRAQARADELTAPLREELEALRARHPADLEEAEQAIRDAYDSAIYTSRTIENAWHSLRPLLSCMDSERRVMAVRQLEKILTKTQEELRKCL